MKSCFLFIENVISGMLPLVFLVFCGVYFTFKTRFVQIRKLIFALKLPFKGKKGQKGKITSWGAACNSLSATVGTGNISGVAAAISTGGAGAVFWMWVSAFLSMAVKSAEITLAMLFRKNRDGVLSGGPMYYIKYGLSKNGGLLSGIFAFLCILSSVTTGNITQVNSCCSVIATDTKAKLLLGIGFLIITAVIIMGGAEKITRFTTYLLPLMAITYIALCFGVILKNKSAVSGVFGDIIKGAFYPKSVTGGAVGSLYKTLICGVQKGIFSNEAGLGTAGMAHASAENADLKTEGYFGIFEVFVDTIVICTLTALTILSSGIIIDYNKLSSSELVCRVFGSLYGDAAKYLLGIMLFVFALSSVLGWANYGMLAAKFIKGQNGEKIFTVIYPFFCVLGALMNVKPAWQTAELCNGIMFTVNGFAVFCLFEKTVTILKGNTNEKNGKFTKRIGKRRSRDYYGRC